MDQELRSQDVLLKMIKIFVIQYLSTIHGFKGFQAEAINILSLYILKMIKNVLLPTKRLVSIQGRVNPNCLHLVDTIRQQKQIKIPKLIQFLDQQIKYSNDNIRISSSCLNKIGRQFTENDAETINGYEKDSAYQSIRAISYGYTYDPKNNPLHIKSPLDQSFKKPPQHTYKDINRKIQKQQKSIEQLTNYSMRQMRRSIGILNLKQGQEQQQSKKKGQKKLKRSIEARNEHQKIKFSMMNYI